jgi:hypothetical protein
MKITLDIPDDNIEFFLELIKKLNLSVVDNQLGLNIPEWHKKIIDERLLWAKQNPDKLLNWEDVLKDLDEE